MPTVKIAALPFGALLQGYAKSGAYTDCYSVTLHRPVSLAEFMYAFYTTPVFKLERWLLALVLRLPSTDQDALALAQDQLNSFAAWCVESREANQAILAAWSTRSWLMVASQSTGGSIDTTLFFGSAVVPRRSGGLGWQFTALRSFHKLYSRVLLGSAASQLARGKA